jgi:2-polyprenyl-3-methyl-5-hydroxy-6-metoxy-1,4-benzoquinol methylase
MFSRTVQDRFEVIRPYVESGEVMDVGCVDARPARHDAATRIARKPNLLFKQITQLNPRALGVDIDPEGIEHLKQAGYEAVCADVETMDLGRKFDCIVAGEIIEHLENPGLFLRNMHRHLADDGVLVLSTPNPFYAVQSWKIWRYGRPAVHEDHVNWQDPATLETLLRRTGFEPFEGYWVQPHTHPIKSWKRLLRPYFSHGFMCVARKAGESR